MNSRATLIVETVSSAQVRALNSILRSTVGTFEPIEAIPGVRQGMMDELMEMGLVETGETGSTLRPVGYRLSTLGKEVHGLLKTRKPKTSKPKLSMMKPRLSKLPPRI